MAAATARQFRPEFFEIRKIRLAEDRGIEQVLHAVALHALELRPALELKIQFIGMPDLEDEDLVPRVAKVCECFEEIRDLAEAVRDDDQQSAPVQFRHEIVKHFPEFRLTARLSVFQFIQNHPQMANS